MAKRTRRQKPTINYLIDLHTEMLREFEEQDRQIDDVREVRTQKSKVNLPDKYRLVDVEVRDASVADEIQRVSATLSVNPPKLMVYPIAGPAGVSTKAQENATLREKWTEEVLKVIGAQKWGPHTYQLAIDAQVGDGGTWTKLLFKPDVWDYRYGLKSEDFKDEYDEEGNIKKSRYAKYDEATEEAKKIAGPPFCWKHVDTRTVYPVWYGDELGEVLEVQRRPVSATFRQYRLAADRDGNLVKSSEYRQGMNEREAEKYNGSTVLFLEHWDDEYVTYAVVGKNRSNNLTGTVVDQWKHGYGRVPYFFAPGIWLNWWRNRKVGWSVSQIKIWLIKYRDFLRTIQAQLAARDTLPLLAKETERSAQVQIGETGEPSSSITQERWDIGVILDLKPGQKISPILMPQILQSIREEITSVNMALEELSTPRVRNEIGTGLEGAGFAVNQLLAEARIRFDPLAENFERMLDDITRFLWHLVRNKVRERVWVHMDNGSSGYISADPDDLTDTVSMQWNLDPEKPSAKIVESRYWHERVASGTASLDMAIEAMGDNPEEVRVGQALDRMRQSEWFIKYMDEYVLQKIGRGDILAKAAEAQQIAESGMLPGMQLPEAARMANTQIVRDPGDMAMAPNGAGARPVPAGPPSGPVPGAPSGMGSPVPSQAAGAGIQQLR